MPHLVKKINLLPLSIFLAVFLLLLNLGFWQLGRADQKRLFLEKQQQMRNSAELVMDDNTPDDIESLKFRRVRITGEYDITHQFLLDNQHVNGKVGYFVLTPLLIKDSNKAVLVNRGWLPLNVDRRVLPELPVKLTSLSLTGRINSFPSVGIKLAGAEIPSLSRPSVVGVVDQQILARKLGYTLYSFQVELDAEQPEGYLREWHSQTVITPEKHIAYAVQWFGLALLLAVLFVRITIKKATHEQTTK